MLHAVPRQVTKFGTSELEVPEEGRELVDRAVRELKDDGANARGEVIRVLEGHVPRGIVETAAAIGADVIVLGTRGHLRFRWALHREHHPSRPAPRRGARDRRPVSVGRFAAPARGDGAGLPDAAGAR